MHAATRALIATVTLAVGAGAHGGEQVPLNVYFGDLHLHTVYSNDAYALGFTERTPDGAYRYAKGAPSKTRTRTTSPARSPRSRPTSGAACCSVRPTGGAAGTCIAT